MKLVYIHGASATGDSFNYIREHLAHGNELILEYDSRNGFDHNLEIMSRSIKKFKDIFFICHSLGGLYALNLANKFSKNVLGAVTLSSPYGGAEVADYAKYFFPFNRLMRDVGTHSKPVRATHQIEIKWPWTNIVTTKGKCPWIYAANDGVVTVNSQRYFKEMDLIELDINHYEVVMSPDVVDIIKLKINSVKSED